MALGINRHSADFQEFLLGIRQGRKERMQELCDELAASGADINLSHVIDEVPHQADEASCVLTRSFLVQAMRRRGLLQAAEGYFDAGRHSPSNQHFPLINEAIAQIHGAGGIALLAHPGCYGNHDTVRQLLTSAPFDGLESNHPAYYLATVLISVPWPKNSNFLNHAAVIFMAAQMPSVHRAAADLTSGAFNRCSSD